MKNAPIFTCAVLLLLTIVGAAMSARAETAQTQLPSPSQTVVSSTTPSPTTPSPTRTQSPAAAPSDLCGLPLRGAIGGLDMTPTPSYSGGYPYSGSGYYGGPGGYDEYYYTPAPTPTPTPLPQPVTSVSRSCEFGQLTITVSTPRHGTYRTGDRIHVAVSIETDSAVVLDFSNLLNGELVFGRSDFELAETPVVHAETNRERTTYTIGLVMQTFVGKPIVQFTMDALYSIEVSNGVPVWRRLTTPSLMITTTSTVDHGEAMLEGDLTLKESDAPPLGMWLTLCGVSGFFLLIALIIVPPVVRALRKRRPRTPDEIAWHHFDRAFRRGKDTGLGRVECAMIASALRARLAYEPATLDEVDNLTAQDARHNDILSALKKCDGIVFAPSTQKNPRLGGGEASRLRFELERIVPKAAHSL